MLDVLSSIFDKNARVINFTTDGIPIYHRTGNESGGGRGTEVYTYGGKQHDEAVRVSDKLNRLGFVNRGVKDGSHLYVVKNTNAKAMLVEVCFVDTDDTDIYKSVGYEKVAQAIAEAITGQEGNTMKLKDISGHWAENAIQKLADYGIVNGDETVIFAPISLQQRRKLHR